MLHHHRALGCQYCHYADYPQLSTIQFLHPCPCNYDLLQSLTEHGCTRRPQDQLGLEFCPDSEDTFLCWEVGVLEAALATTAFLVDIFTSSGEGEDVQHAGLCYIYPENLTHTVGTLSSPITSIRSKPIGKLTGVNLSETVKINTNLTVCVSVDYLITRPTPDLKQDFSLSLRNHWSEDWKGLDVGHRGLGNSYTTGHQ